MYGYIDGLISIALRLYLLDKYIQQYPPRLLPTNVISLIILHFLMCL